MSEKKCFYRVVVDFIIVLIPFKLSLVFNDFQSSFLSEREREREREEGGGEELKTQKTHTKNVLSGHPSPLSYHLQRRSPKRSAKTTARVMSPTQPGGAGNCWPLLPA